MEKTHPCAEAVYRVVPQAGSTFGIEVIVADTHPTTVTSFASEADAEAWIANHKQRVQQPMSRSRGRLRTMR